MPRQIIDTESSRPAYERRRLATFVTIAILVVAFIFGLGWKLRSHAGAPVPVSAPGNSVR
jgi:hypothetical protein